MAAAPAPRRQRPPCFAPIVSPFYTGSAALSLSARPLSSSSSSSLSRRHARRSLGATTMVAANPLPPSTRSNITQTKGPRGAPVPSSLKLSSPPSPPPPPPALSATTTKTKPKTTSPRKSASSSSSSARPASGRAAVSSPSAGVGMVDARFIMPVPQAKPHEVNTPKRGRNSQRRARYAEHFRRYLYLRRLLKPWSEAFRARHGRTPSLVDVHDSGIPGLFDRFVEYLEALDGLRVDA